MTLWIVVIGGALNTTNRRRETNRASPAELYQRSHPHAKFFDSEFYV
jgi:hypothetical protein